MIGFLIGSMVIAAMTFSIIQFAFLWAGQGAVETAAHFAARKFALNARADFRSAKASALAEASPMQNRPGGKWESAALTSSILPGTEKTIRYPRIIGRGLPDPSDPRGRADRTLDQPDPVPSRSDSESLCREQILPVPSRNALGHGGISMISFYTRQVSHLRHGNVGQAAILFLTTVSAILLLVFSTIYTTHLGAEKVASSNAVDALRSLRPRGKLAA
jgi:hypothetical protein